MANFRAIGGMIGNCHIVGPSHIDNTTNYIVEFDNLSDGNAYELLLEDGTGKYTKVVKTTSGSGIKLSYTVAPTYIAMDGVTSTPVTTSTNFFLLVI